MGDVDDTSLTPTPHQREDVSALDRFNMHRCPTRRVFSGTGIELMTCLPWKGSPTYKNDLRLQNLCQKCGALTTRSRDLPRRQLQNHHNGHFRDVYQMKTYPEFSPNQLALRITWGIKRTLIRIEDMTPLMTGPFLCSLYHSKSYHRGQTFKKLHHSARLSNRSPLCSCLATVNSDTCRAVAVHNY
ncbi:hypothetical protein TNCV_1757661 [Trichonephila clavipes]|nr:hypothetical protein TNCV_1757661 [Trichonephila clavipes]